MYNVGNTVNFKSPDGVIQIDITLSDLIDISEGKGDLYSPIEITKEILINLGFIHFPEIWYRYEDPITDFKYDLDDFHICIYGSWETKQCKHLHELQDIYKALTGKHLILK